MISISLSPVRDFDALGKRWRDLEERADGSFFQGWTWTGCLARERFDDPVLLEAVDQGVTVALALFNRVRRVAGPATLYLGESGQPALDAPYIEYNGILTARDAPADLVARCLDAARRAPIAGQSSLCARHVVMNGIDVDTLNAARAAGLNPRVVREQTVWVADLDGHGTYLDRRSANTRQQLRRSDRAYEAAGGLTIRAAGSVNEALDFLTMLRDLHQTTWQARGKPGAFAAPFFGRFHHAL
ncbi:MAG: GNAT family N-acetyltransferase, partial [Acetobacteraceae bacterium]